MHGINARRICDSPLTAALSGIEAAVQAADAHWIGGGAYLQQQKLGGAYPIVGKFMGTRSPWKRPHIDLHLPQGAAQGHELWNALGPVGPSCSNVLTFARGDDMKTACTTNETYGTDNVIISVGSNNQWAFENDVLKKLPQTAVHTFDCTLGTHVDHAVRSGKVRGLTFHDACLGMKDVDADLQPAPRAKNATRAPNAIATTGRPRSRFRTWQSLLALAGLTRSPAYVKMDIEGSEWSVLPAIMSAQPELQPLQLAVEVHYIVGEGDQLRIVSPGELSAFLAHLYLAGGYMMLRRRDNPSCMHCSEILLGKVLCDGHSPRKRTER